MGSTLFSLCLILHKLVTLPPPNRNLDLDLDCKLVNNNFRVCILGSCPLGSPSSSFLPAFDLPTSHLDIPLRAVRNRSRRAGALDTLRHRGICRSGSTFDPSWRQRKDIVLARFSRRAFSPQRVDVRWIYTALDALIYKVSRTCAD